MDIFRYVRWQLRPERPAIEHVEHRTIDQNVISVVDGVAVVRDVSHARRSAGREPALRNAGED